MAAVHFTRLPSFSPGALAPFLAPRGSRRERPDVRGIFKRVQVLPIETFDSGATPKAGERRVVPKSLADVDLDAFRRDMAATLEKAKADDPRELRRRIAELERELRARPTAAPSAPAAPPGIVRFETLMPAQAAELDRQAARLETVGDALQGFATAVRKTGQDLNGGPGRPVRAIYAVRGEIATQRLWGHRLKGLRVRRHFHVIHNEARALTASGRTFMELLMGSGGNGVSATPPRERAVSDTTPSSRS